MLQTEGHLVASLPSAESAYAPKADSYRWHGVRLSNLQRYIDTGAHGQPICGETQGPARARAEAADILLAAEKAIEGMSVAVEMALAGQVEETDVCALTGRRSLLASVGVCVVPGCTRPPSPGYRGMCKAHYLLCRRNRPDLTVYMEAGRQADGKGECFGGRAIRDTSGFGVGDRVSRRIPALLHDFDHAETDAQRETVRRETCKTVLATVLLVSSVIVPLGEILCMEKTTLADLEESGEGTGKRAHYGGSCLAGCGSPAETRGLCRYHYQIARRGDATLAALMLPPHAHGEDATPPADAGLSGDALAQPDGTLKHPVTDDSSATEPTGPQTLLERSSAEL